MTRLSFTSKPNNKIFILSMRENFILQINYLQIYIEYLLCAVYIISCSHSNQKGPFYSSHFICEEWDKKRLYVTSLIHLSVQIQGCLLYLREVYHCNCGYIYQNQETHRCHWLGDYVPPKSRLFGHNALYGVRDKRTALLSCSLSMRSIFISNL